MSLGAYRVLVALEQLEALCERHREALRYGTHRDAAH
jgi:hypothetical protein